MARSADYPTPNQGTTSGDPSEIECPTCGKANDVAGDHIEEGDALTCAHCDARFVVTGVDYSVTITVKAGLADRLVRETGQAPVFLSKDDFKRLRDRAAMSDDDPRKDD